MSQNEITVRLPRERPFFGVVHLVVGGLAARHDLNHEQLEDLQVALAELALTPCGGFLAALHGAAHIVLHPECRGAVRHTGREAGDFLHRLLNREAHGANGGIDALCGIHGTVRHEIDLVELGIHSVDGSSRLVDDRKELFLGSLDERRKPPESSAQPHERVAERDADREQEDRKREVDEVVPGESEHEGHVYEGRS